MKKIIIYFFIVAAGFALAGCEKDPYVSKDVIQRMRDSVLAASPTNICFIYNNDVYFLDQISNTPQKITSTPGNAKTEVRISHNLAKIAYLNSAGNPEIIGRDGNIITTLAAYTSVQQMDWSNDDATLYILSDSHMYYYGPALSIPTLSLSGFPVGPAPYGAYVLKASLSKYNDLAYIVEYFDPTYGYLQKLVIKKNDGSNTSKIIVNANYPDQMRYVKFSSNDRDLALGYGYYGNEITKLELYTNLKTYADQTIEVGTYTFLCPVYRADKHSVVTCINTDGTTGSSFHVCAYNLSRAEFTNRNEYNSSTAPLSLDWK